MALNSYATPDGKEIGRAQAVQAEAAGLECTTDMNPILLKPSGELRSQVIVNGRPYGNTDAKTYFSTDGKDFLRDVNLTCGKGILSICRWRLMPMRK